jgi:hypothetical protein
MYEADNQAYLYSHGRPEPGRIRPDDLYGIPVDSEPGDPRAPFFLD